MESKTNYTLIGITVLLLAAALLSSLLWLSVGLDRKNYNTYAVYMHEAAGGLSEESPVKLNGVKVGMISSIELSKIDPQKIKLLLKIADGTLITTSTHATLITQGITGTTYLGLTASTPTLTLLKKKGSQPYPVIPYKVSFLGQLQDNITDISTSLKRVFDKENAARISSSLVSLQKISNTIEQNNQNINQTLHDLPEVMRELKTSIREIIKTTKKISKASEHVSSAMQAGKDGVNQITEQTLPPATILLQRLDLIATNMEQITSLMKQNPSVIIRGTTPQKLGPGE